jgi:beta-1,4-mannooligosaccharide/beta-1,4-mannosyl-N-acetylglucosamine phosphorylase
MIKQPTITRYSGNPILSAADLSYSADLVFNAGVVKFKGQYVMAFRNDYNYPKSMFEDHFAGKGELHGPSTNIGIAFSADGYNWHPADLPIFQLNDEEIQRVYDPRLTVLDGRCYMAFAIDTKHGDNRCGLAVTDDFESFEIVTITPPNNRNVLLFPEKINGLYYRMERPFNGAKGDIWISSSPDLRFWGNWQRLLSGRNLSFCNSKIGPGAPPIKTEKGWLCLFHTVTQTSEDLLTWEKEWHSLYSIGIMLLDLDDPTKIVGIYDSPLLKPEADYELDGFRGSVVFPGGMILEDTGEVKIYYGAADTVECLATAQLDDLLALCIEH